MTWYKLDKDARARQIWRPAPGSDETWPTLPVSGTLRPHYGFSGGQPPNYEADR
jgi:hypothetical protein